MYGTYLNPVWAATCLKGRSVAATSCRCSLDLNALDLGVDGSGGNGLESRFERRA